MVELLDKHRDTIASGLTRALAAPHGLPLLAPRQGGLFTSTAAGKQAAQAALEAGLLVTLRDETKGKTTTPICILSDRGLEFLRSQTNPRELVPQLAKAVEARGPELARLQHEVEQLRLSFENLRKFLPTLLFGPTPTRPPAEVERNGSQPQPPSGPPRCTYPPDLDHALLEHLDRWQQQHAGDDCPLPELWRRAQQFDPNGTVGRFHDVIRRWHTTGQVHLHPWTGPLHELPEPGIAVLVGHAIIYYVSKR